MNHNPVRGTETLLKASPIVSLNQEWLVKSYELFKLHLLDDTLPRSDLWDLSLDY